MKSINASLILKKIKKVRSGHHMTQKELAQAIGLSIRYISKIEILSIDLNT